MGVYATRNAAGTGISLMSSSDFDVDSTVADTNAANGMFTDAAVTTTAADETLQNDTGAAEAAIASISTAVSRLGVVQGKIGTAQNKLSYAIQLAQSQVTSFSAAESRIRDADVASEAANLTKAQVLQQASLAALAQANSAPQAVLSLLRG
jgi:flagellin